MVDGNLPTFTLRHITQLANKLGVPVFFEPTSVPKAVAAAEVLIVYVCVCVCVCVYVRVCVCVCECVKVSPRL